MDTTIPTNSWVIVLWHTDGAASSSVLGTVEADSFEEATDAAIESATATGQEFGMTTPQFLRIWRADRAPMPLLGAAIRADLGEGPQPIPTNIFPARTKKAKDHASIQG